MEISPAFIGFLLWKHKHHTLDKTLGKKKQNTPLPRGKTQQADPGECCKKVGLTFSQATGQEAMTSICSRGEFDWIF